MIDYDEIKTFEQNLRGKEYEDDLSKYFELFYKLLLTARSNADCKIGEIYYHKNEDMYMVIINQIVEHIDCVNLLYDVNGRLLYPCITSCMKISDLDERYEKIGTYDVFMEREDIRIKLGLENERKLLLEKLDFVNEELELKKDVVIRS